MKGKNNGNLITGGSGNAVRKRKVRNVKKTDLKMSLIVSSIVSALFFVGGGAYAYWSGGSYDADNRITVTIDSPDDITEIGINVCNDNLKLSGDIHITDSSFSVGNDPYLGVFDGCGHTVYLDYPVGKETDSFFPAIGKSGVVKNTRFVFTNVAIEGGFFSGVAKINYGTMQDCAVEYNLQFDAKEGTYTPFVNVNYGVVKNIVTSGTFAYGIPSNDRPDTGENAPAESESDSEQDSEKDTAATSTYDENVTSVALALDDGEPTAGENGSVHSAVRNDDEKKIAFAGTCTYNFGELKNVISSPRFVGFYCTLRENYLAGRSENIAISSVCSFIGTQAAENKMPTEKGLVSIHEKTLYTSDDRRLDKYESFSSLIFDADGALIKTIIENTYDFNNNVWEIDETNLCLKLK